jgi:ABC-2 type transport system ATP-binding protein
MGSGSLTELLQVRNLTKAFGPLVAVDDVSFSVPRGEVLGFLGPNGAGKSTTMKMITGFMAPTRGTAVVCGHDVVADPIEVKKSIGYLPEGAPLYGDMTPRALLNFVAKIRGLRGAERRRKVDEAIQTTHIEEVAFRPIDTLSKGFKRRVGLAQAVLHNPDVLVLDEPTDGLDPNQKHDVRSLLRAMAKDKAIIISTHILEEVDAVCTRAIIISRGRIAASGTPDELRARSAVGHSVSIRLHVDHVSGFLDRLMALDGVGRVESVGAVGEIARLIAVPAGKNDILATVTEFVAASNLPGGAVEAEPTRLDDAFREITT